MRSLLLLGFFRSFSSAFVNTQVEIRNTLDLRALPGESNRLGSILSSSAHTVSRSNESTISDDDTSGSRIQSRRAFTKGSIFSTITSLAINPLIQGPEVAMASDDDGEDLVNVYFGCGCFWHVQHEFVEAEKKILGRKDDQITARAGYAGGTSGAVDGKVCYHNAASIADYGKLGHAEVVSLSIPPSKFKDFAIEYFKLFNANGDRPDQGGDRGSEYRSLVGFPGGAKSDYAKLLVDASIATGDKLDFAYGKGDDKDARKVAFVMDSEAFPFFVAEQYHQFHDGFNFNENYPGTYNNLAVDFAKSGEKFGNCPNGAIGLGIGGL